MNSRPKKVNPPMEIHVDRTAQEVFHPGKTDAWTGKQKPYPGDAHHCMEIRVFRTMEVARRPKIAGTSTAIACIRTENAHSCTKIGRYCPAKINLRTEEGYRTTDLHEVCPRNVNS